MTDPWRIYILFSDTGTIRKWDFTPFEIDGTRATEFHSASVHGLHTCSDACDRPLCVAQRTIERLTAERDAARAILPRDWLRNTLAAERERCAKVATSFLVGDPRNGIPLRSPLPLERIDTRSIQHPPYDHPGDVA